MTGRKERNERRRFLRLMKKIYQFLESDEITIEFKRMEEYCGLMYFRKKLMLINPCEHILLTLIHECCHFLFSRKKLKRDNKISEEDQILKIQELCARHLNHAQALKLTKLLLHNLTEKGTIKEITLQD